MNGMLDRRAVVPRATMRLQFHSGFTLTDAIQHIPYFAQLGISHIYSSPLLTAWPGSTHGYDIIDHNEVNPELGGRAALERFVEVLHQNGLGLILDFVPNHMGIGGSGNAWWLDVLEWGRYSPFARYFDIDWEPLEPALAGKILVPFLGTHYGDALQAGDLCIRFDQDAGTLSIWYHEHRFPIAPHDYATILNVAVDGSPSSRDRDALADLAGRFRRLGRGYSDPTRQEDLSKRAIDAKVDLAKFVASSPKGLEAVQRAVAVLSGVRGQRRSFDALHRILERQFYRLAFWRVATDEINYRRFFDINSLIGLRMESPELFEISHRLIYDLIKRRMIDGIRLDHVDGLLDPEGYFSRLQRHAAEALAESGETGDGEASHPERRFIVLIEKILAPKERLRPGWAVDGTTGYEFMAQVGGLFVRPESEAAIRSIYARFTGSADDYDSVATQARREIVESGLSSELNVLTNLLSRLAKSNRWTRDFTQNAIRRALINIVAHFPVYRTYVSKAGADGDDLRFIEWAIGRARKHAVRSDSSILDFIQSILAVQLDRLPGQNWRRADVLAEALKFQQFTGPVAAKSEEDTAFYRYVPLISLNEVGSSPGVFGLTPAAFHQACNDRQGQYRHGLLATATHDHKRGEDTRARINVLSEIPHVWSRELRKWSRLNRHKRRELPDGEAPSRNDEYLLYQTLIGAWPLALETSDQAGLDAFSDRITAYMIKAAREAKLRSSWATPNEPYETAVAQFVKALLSRKGSPGFLARLFAFQNMIKPVGALNGLAQTTLKLTVPGIPDIYQGTETWDLSLVDPDNRRPVPFDRLAQSMALAKQRDRAELLHDWADGGIKQFLVHSLLRLRSDRSVLFSDGGYASCQAEGQYAECVVAFRRYMSDQEIVVIVPRLVGNLMDGVAQPLVPAERWQETSITLDGQPRTFQNLFTNELVAAWPIKVSEALKQFPVAVLM